LRVSVSSRMDGIRVSASPIKERMLRMVFIVLSVCESL
jgi:hypothetical protein